VTSEGFDLVLVFDRVNNLDAHDFEERLVAFFLKVTTIE
jgi:hypothetical protein